MSTAAAAVRGRGSAPPAAGETRHASRNLGAALLPDIGFQIGMWLLGKVLDFVQAVARLLPHQPTP